ncbi:MAG TPA: hypothetical protein VGN17_01240 [Bryobacteraceae bacterium]|jgi:hypothetical protein
MARRSIIQFRAQADPLFGAHRQVSTQIGKISTEEDLIDSRHVAKYAQDRVAGRKRGVPIDSPEHVRSGASLFAAGNETHLVDDREPGSEKGDRAPRMREEVFHAGRARESVCIVHLSDSAIGVCRKVQLIVGESQRVSSRVTFTT